ncbi:S-layer homology domain-containing protein [Paenibacillus sp. PAMC21692]|uniref:S-layer homology domain-containing protein n=1 Tax=Paenibacillus sp. PAMC21692 TaxID=2762320 RepID=UPI00164DF0A7|nr:S-layer homology domain-containing protein [Paenibacillus sp. PAMC21692]QNK56303.1 S-layer homology domain-containing protein [Paenibacillus sp. PAMC21692]
MLIPSTKRKINVCIIWFLILLLITPAYPAASADATGNQAVDQLESVTYFFNEGELDVEEFLLKYASEKLYVGSYGTVGVIAALESGPELSLPETTAVYVSTDENVIQIDAATGRFEAVGTGEATIQATIEYYGQQYVANLDLAVSPGHVYSFGRDDLVPGTDKWHLVGAPYGEYEIGVNFSDGSANIEAYADGHARSFRFYVHEAGFYDMKFQGILMEPFGGIGELIVDGEAVGDFNFYGPYEWGQWKASEIRDIGIVYLSSGMHDLTIRAKGHETGHTRRNMFPLTLVLEPRTEPLDVARIQWKNKPERLMPGESVQLELEVELTNGQKLPAIGATVTQSSSDETVAVLEPVSGLLKALQVGSTTLSAEIEYEGRSYTDSFNLVVESIAPAKQRVTLYTEQERLAARTNIQTYEWAASMHQDAVDKADYYLDQGLDYLWSIVPPQSLPRSIFVNQEQGSPLTGRDIDAYGIYPYQFDPVNHPWKVLDPSSGQYFPTNDFESYYNSGLDMNGLFDPELADRTLLFNTDHPDPDDPLHLWGVDDGYGWVDEDGNYYTFIAYYVHWALWGYNGRSFIQQALSSFRDAYLYTGDVKYARAGTVLIDRIADVYPSLDISEHGREHYINSDGFTGLGKAVGNIWEPILAKDFISSYDAFFPAMDDPELIQFLSAKSETFQLGPYKSSASGIRKNIEDGIIRQIYPGIRRAQIASNNGIHQGALAMAAVVYDKLPETQEWMDFNYKSGYQVGPPHQVTGGNMGVTFVNAVDRDGVGHESSPGYNQLWLGAYLEIADILKGYDGFIGADLYDNVKFRKMFSGLYPLMLSQRFTANIGDASSTGNPWFAFSMKEMIEAFKNYGDPIFAQLIYFLNSNRTTGIHDSIFSEDPEKLKRDIESVIAEHGTLRLDSQMLSGYGTTILRDGDNPPLTAGLGKSFVELPVIEMSPGTSVKVQNSLLEYAAANVGDQITFRFDVSSAGEYDVLIQPARTIWYGGMGIYEISLDDQPIKQLDFYGNSQNLESLGKHQLQAGTHTITFKAIGKQSFVNRYHMALHEIRLLGADDYTEYEQQLDRNTLRDLWMYYGRNYGHGHGDTLNLGLTAFGLDLMPDLGYPESTLDTDTHFTEWIRNTISHNTVMVDQSMQTAHWVGEPRQFDEGSMVKMMDVEAPEVYPQTDLYKRTSAMIRVDEANSYVVDFFRVQGGSEHHFSFHAAEGDVTVEGLSLTAQETGTYEGDDTEYGIRPDDTKGSGYQYRGSGFHYLQRVERDSSPADQFSVDWDIKDTWKLLAEPEDIHLRLTMLTSTDEVALADGIPSRTDRNNPDSLRYMIAKRTGENLSSTFTSVIQPYKDEQFISAITSVEVKSGSTVVEDMDVRAVKVTLANGRVDYIISALDPDIVYTIDDKLQFKGTFGMYAEQEGQTVYSYVNDGTVIGKIALPEINQTIGSIQGTVIDFTKQLNVHNEIIVDMDVQGFTLSDLVNRTIYVENDGERNAVYTIKGITDMGDGRYALSIDDTTLIRSYVDDNDYGKGFKYDIAENANFRIPLSHEKVVSPLPVDPVVPVDPGDPKDSNGSDDGSNPDATIVQSDPGNAQMQAIAQAGDRANALLTAVSKVYDIQMPAGSAGESFASLVTVSLAFDPQADTGLLGVYRFGENGELEYLGGTISGSTIELQLSAPGKLIVLSYDKEFDDVETNHWAYRMLKEIAAKHMINGVSPTKYEPYREVTRAEYTAMLIRMLGLEAVEGQTFSDVDPSTWYADAVSTAAATGLVNGKGDYRFAPEWSITREEMVVMLVRAYGLKHSGQLLLPKQIAGFKDRDQTSGWAMESLDAATALGLINGRGGNAFVPKGLANRAEAAQTIYNLMLAK